MVYKNGIPYDISYQVTDKDCPEIPNTIERLSDNSGKFLVLDNSWLPYLTIRAGEYLFDSYNRLNSFDTIKLIPNDVPAGCQLDLGGARLDQNTKSSQILIDNRNARWGAVHLTGADTNLLNLAVIDEKFTGYTQWAHSGDIKTRLLWIPNGTISNVCHWTPENNTGIAIINALNMGGVAGGDNPSKIYETIYLNEELHQKMLDEASFEWITYYEPRTIEYAADETEWLEDYFVIDQDGQTVNWYDNILTGEIGKYIRLMKNSTLVAEKCYFKEDELSEDIDVNLSDTAVTKTGSVTVGQMTKTYSVVQGPIIRTLKARIYFNPVTEDGKDFNNFCIWPFYFDTGVRDSRFSQFVNSIKKIRYKAASASAWTDAHVYTYAELVQRAESLGGDIAMTEAYTLQITTPGYYDIEWMYDAALLKNTSWDDWNWPHPCLTDAKTYYNYEEHYRETKWREDMYLTDPWIASVDFGDQYINNVSINWNDIYLREWDDNPNMETFSFGQATVPQNGFVLSGILTRGLKYLVYNNVSNPYGCNFINIENWNSTFSNEGTLFYNCSTRQPFNDWWLGINTGTRIAATIYLHPDVYSLTNHGFDNTVNGWNEDKYNEMLNQGIQFLELPSNWKTLIPNYIGE